MYSMFASKQLFEKLCAANSICHIAGASGNAVIDCTSRSGRPAACSIGPRRSLARPVLMLSSSGTSNKGSRETSSSGMSSVVTTPLIVRQCY